MCVASTAQEPATRLAARRPHGRIHRARWRVLEPNPKPAARPAGRIHAEAAKLGEWAAPRGAVRCARSGRQLMRPVASCGDEPTRPIGAGRCENDGTRQVSLWRTCQKDTSQTTGTKNHINLNLRRVTDRTGSRACSPLLLNQNFTSLARLDPLAPAPLVRRPRPGG